MRNALESIAKNSLSTKLSMYFLSEFPSTETIRAFNRVVNSLSIPPFILFDFLEASNSLDIRISSPVDNILKLITRFD